MKITSKIAALFLFCLFLTNSMEAQRRGGTPEENAERQTSQMTDSLTLSTAQVTKVAEVNLKYAKLMAEFRTAARESEDFDRSMMREGMMKIRGEHRVALKVFLTAEQFEKMEKMEEAKRARRGERGGKGKKKKKREDRS